MPTRKLALLAVTCAGIAQAGTALSSARAAVLSANGGQVYIPGRRNAGGITQITGDGLMVALRDGDQQAVQFKAIWRVREAFGINEPEGTIVIDYAGSRLFVAARLGDVIAAAAGKVPLTKFTAPNGQVVYLSAARVTDVSNALPGLHNPLSKSLIRANEGGQQVQEPAAAAKRIIDAARANQ